MIAEVGLLDTIVFMAVVLAGPSQWWPCAAAGLYEYAGSQTGQAAEPAVGKSGMDAQQHKACGYRENPEKLSASHPNNLHCLGFQGWFSWGLGRG